VYKSLSVTDTPFSSSLFRLDAETLYDLLLPFQFFFISTQLSGKLLRYDQLSVLLYFDQFCRDTWRRKETFSSSLFRQELPGAVQYAK